MKVWLAQHRQALALTLRRLLGNPFSTLFSVLVIGIALSLPAGLYVLLHNLGTASGNVSAAPQLSVFLALDASRQDVTQIQARLQRHASIRDVRFIPREQALQDLKQNAGVGDVVASLPHNPLPDALVVTPKSDDPAALGRLRDELRQWPKIAHVQLDSAWAERLAALLKLGRQAVLILAVLLGIALVAITGNTIRLQILTQREEIEVARLIGATDAFIRRPLLYFGALQGLTGGAAAWLVVSASLHLLNTGVAELAALYAADFKLSALNSGDSARLLLLSTGLGWLGAYVSVARHLRLIEPR
jgi:cell division transport system permease protein